MDDCDNDGLPDNPSGAPSLKRRKTAAIVSESDDERRAECHMPEEENDDNRSNSSLMEVQPGSRRRSRCIKGRFRAAQRRQAENRRMRHAVPGMRTMDMPDESQSDSE